MESGELSSYQLMVLKNIEENKRVLRSLGLPIGTPNQPKKKVASCTRKSVSRQKRRQSAAQEEFQPIQRRTRQSSSVLQSIGFDDFPDTNNDEENTPPQKKRELKSEPIFGEIEGVSVGDWWPSRLDCSAAGVHRPTVAGIHGKQDEGCYSIALSGGYEDDLDCGTCFTYTGSGGRDLRGTKSNPKNLRTARQSKDQVLEGPNAALTTNIESKKPVRVIRGFKLQSPYAPEEGYRYDGLYSVEKYWTATGISGFKVYKFALKRLQDQDPSPWESCADQEPRLTKELSTEEVNAIPIHVENMDIPNSVSPNSGYESLRDCSPKLTSRISPRDMVRKQISPRQHHKINCNETSETDEIVSAFLSKFQQDLEDDSGFRKVSSYEETSKLTENIICNAKNHLENNIDSLSVNLEKENHSCQSSIEGIPLHSSPNFVTPTKNKRPSSLKDLKSKTIVSPLKSSEKKVRFSPTVLYTYEGCRGVVKVEEEENCSNDFSDLANSSYSDGKKQVSILNYFSPIKKTEENQIPKNIVNPKSLRSNRFSNFTLITLSNNISTHSGESSSNKNDKVLNNKSVMSPGENGCKSSSHKRKYSSFTKRKENSFDLDLPLYKKRPSMMENLIKQNSDKLKLHNQIMPTKRKINHELVIPIKPCSVVLKRMREKHSNQTVIPFEKKRYVAFIGWDLEAGHFSGFDEIIIAKTQAANNTFKQFFDKFQDSTEKKDAKLIGFQGWDVNKDDFQGSSGLVPIAFIIDKLSKS